jgi:AraC-like DNA-binding protein
LRANLLHTTEQNLIQIRYICPIIDLIGQIIVVFYGLLRGVWDCFTKQSQNMLLYLTLSTFALAVLLLANNYNKNKTAVYVALFLMIVSLYGITHYLVLFGQSPFWLAIFYNHFTPLYLLLGPLLFFYVRATLRDQSGLSKLDSLHFIPAVIQTIGITPYLFLPFALKIEYAERIIKNVNNILEVNLNLFYTAEASFLIRGSMFLIYILYCGYLLLVNAPLIRKENTIPKKQFNVSLKWLAVLISCSLLITIYLFSVTMMSFYVSPKEAFNNSYVLNLISGISYFIMTFSLLLFPHILYGMPRKNENTKNIKKVRKNEISSGVASFVPEEDPLFELSEKIKDYLINQKPFLNPDFAISDIAIELQVPQNHISYCINTLMNTSFYKLRTELRVEHAVALLQSDKKERLTIEAIGEQSGFKTRSNFYSAFKEITGMTPTEYYSKSGQQLV